MAISTERRIVPIPDGVEAWRGVGSDSSVHGRAVDHKLGILLDMVRPHGARILDVGVGGGGLLAAWDSANFCVGLDVNRAPCRVLHDRRLSAVVAQAGALPFRRGTFDCLVASELVEHLPDIDAFFHEARRVLRPGSDLLLVVPNDRNWFLYRIADANFRAAFRDRGHLRRFGSLGEVRRLGERYGFELAEGREHRRRLRFRDLPLPARVALHYVVRLRVPGTGCE